MRIHTNIGFFWIFSLNSFKMKPLQNLAFSFILDIGFGTNKLNKNGNTH